MARRCEPFPSGFDDLFDYTESAAHRPGRPIKDDLTGWRVLDDWPSRVPVSTAEVDLFEAWFGDVFDTLFGST